VRDYSPAAQKLFEDAVPPELLAVTHRDTAGRNTTWQDAFGADAEEFFHAWSVAHYIGQVAAAGKAEYPLPLYVNAALRDPLQPSPPGSYESGGATDNVLAIWKAAAPAIDLLAPDIYLGDSARYFKVLDLYPPPGQRAVRARDRRFSGVRPLLFRRAGTWGDRVFAVRDRRQRLPDPCARRAESD